MIRLEQGRIGAQETVSLVAMALYVSTVFVMDSKRAYSAGNSSYIWAPCAVLAALGIFLLAAYAMKLAGQKNLATLADYALGNAAGAAARLLFSAYLLYSAFAALAKFAAIMRSLIYIDAQMQQVLAWMIPAVALPAMWGLECLGRVAKCIAGLVALIVLIGFIGPISDFELCRIYPLAGDGALAVLTHTAQHQLLTLPAFIALLSVTQGVHGPQSALKCGAIAAAIGGGMILISQLVLALTYTYKDLSEMFVPLYRQNMLLIREDYFFRLDKITAFLWLICCFIAVAFYIYAAALLLCGKKGVRDIRPAVLGLSVAVFSLVLIGGSDPAFAASPALAWMDEYGCIPLAALTLTVGGIGLAKARLRRRRGGCDEKSV